MKKSAAILGKAATAALAPFGDPEWDVWCLAWHFTGGQGQPLADLLFDIHKPSFKTAPELAGHFNSHLNPAYFKLVNGSGLPVLCDPESVGPGEYQFHAGQPYPLGEVVAALPRSYLDCTVSYMIAYAILKGYERIGLYGCNFKTGEEHALQAQSAAYLIGVAEGKGIEVYVAPGSPFLCSGYVQGRYGVTQEKRWQGGWI